ncbi:MAG: hypothetical protein SX243_23185 [Acidobacteriota bacterium]|nr:hypothetical protein [Acidobacteriota bacterium]
MAWIKTIPFTEASDELQKALEKQRELYPEEYDRLPNDDGSSSIVASHTLIPDALFHAFATFGTLSQCCETVVGAGSRCQYSAY